MKNLLVHVGWLGGTDVSSQEDQEDNVDNEVGVVEPSAITPPLVSEQ